MDTNILNADIADLYERIILDRARTPRHGGRLACFDADAEGDNPMCGDRVHVWIRRGEGGALEAIGHEAKGCAIMSASADLMADAVRGLAPAQIERLRGAVDAMLGGGAPVQGDLAALSGVAAYRSRIRCATLPWVALAQALEKQAGMKGAGMKNTGEQADG